MVSFLSIMAQSMETEAANTLARQGYWPAVACEYFAEGNYSKAADLCQRMLEKEPQVVSGRVILARSLYHAGQYRQSREQFVQVLKLDSDNLVALKYLGDLLFRIGEEAAAMAYYRRIFEIDPHTTGLKCAIIERTEAVETRQLTIRRPGESAPARKATPLLEPAFITETAGDIYREQGYFQLAREVYFRLLKRRENNRIADKLKETEAILKKRENSHESPNR